ncbi:NUDIX hydrolase [Mariniluteicoccus flavus]
MANDRILAAGAVVLRGEGSFREVLVVHRPHHDDWSLPKGKLEGGELLPVCATREVAEETGAVVRLDIPLGTTDYKVKGRAKRVHFWRAGVETMVGAPQGPEVDEVRWVGLADVGDVLSYPAEAALVRAAAAAPPTTALIITRHGKAMDRKRWAHRDPARPITDRGRHQAREVARVLAAFGVRRIASSSSNRCVSTVLPYATLRHAPIERATILSEERGKDSPDEVGAYMRALARSAVDNAAPTVVCGHRPVLPAMLAGLGLPNQPFRTGESAVVHLTADYGVHAAERIRTLS